MPVKKARHYDENQGRNPFDLREWDDRNRPLCPQNESFRTVPRDSFIQGCNQAALVKDTLKMGRELGAGEGPVSCSDCAFSQG